MERDTSTYEWARCLREDVVLRGEGREIGCQSRAFGVLQKRASRMEGQVDTLA